MHHNKSSFLLLLLLATTLIWSGCKQSDPNDVLGRKGDVVHFAGRKWDVKSGYNGPGPNTFSKDYESVWVDENGYLHLTILKKGAEWFSSEVISQDTMGYGTYVWTIQADPVKFASNVVLGLFTWDNNTFYEEANSEVDIEFSKWGGNDQTNVLTTSVQPVWFGTYYPERTHVHELDSALLRGVTTHLFHWTDTLITWKSFRGKEWRNAEPMATWDFDLDHPARIKSENGQNSVPIVIPGPGSTTNARMNFWTQTYLAYGPSNGLEHEVVIQNFEYIPTGN
jgi:hypothetical protein